jgi:hypothetical protein
MTLFDSKVDIHRSETFHVVGFLFYKYTTVQWHRRLKINSERIQIVAAAAAAYQ